MHKPFLSFCIPTYNRWFFLKETIESILISVKMLPSDIKYEIIISDNASTDNTNHCLSEFSEELSVRYFRREATTHPADNLFYACSKATGEYIWLLGDDDPMFENAVEKVIESIKTKHIDYLFVPRELVNNDLSPHPCGMQPKSSMNSLIKYISGKELFNDPKAEFFSLVGFYGCNIIRRSLWEQSVKELDIPYSSLINDVWAHIKIILYSIVNRPVARLGAPGVRCRLNPSSAHKDSHIWLDEAIIVLKKLPHWGYSEKTVNQEICFVFHANAYMFISNKITRSRSGNLSTLAKNLQCDKIINKIDCWFLISYFPLSIIRILIIIKKIFSRILKQKKWVLQNIVKLNFSLKKINYFSLHSTNNKFCNSYSLLLKRLLDLQRQSNNELAGIFNPKYSDDWNDSLFYSKIRVAGFGTNDDWRKNGIWASFQRLTDFHLFEIPNDNYLGNNNEEVQRLLKERDFVNFIDKNGPFHIAFFTHSGRHISTNLLQKLKDRGIFIVIMSVDDKHQFISPCDINGTPHQIRISALADLYWTNWPLAVNLVNSLGGRGWFSPPGADPEIYKPNYCQKDIDIVFVGLKYGERSRIIKTLQQYFRVEAFGKGWKNGPVTFNEMLKLYSRAKIVLGIGGVSSTLGVQTLKGRDFEVPMCGATYLTSFNPELAEFFTIGQEIVCWSSIENCIEVISSLLYDPRRCEIIGVSARQRSVREHTWDIRVKKILNLFKQQMDK